MNSTRTLNKKGKVGRANGEREARWDNAKCLLIFSVVIGHVLYHFVNESALARSIYFFIYTYHMPVFVFLSGMFSVKATHNRQYHKVILYLMIYVLMKSTDAIAASIGTGKLSFHLFWESGPGWYALAMAVWFFVSFLLENYVEGYDKRKWFLLSLIIGILCGYDNHLGDHYASLRILNFYPFFVLGTMISPKSLLEYTKHFVMKIISFILLGVVFFISLNYIEEINWLLKLLKGKYPYESMGITTMSAIPMKIVYYIFVMIVGFAILCVVTSHYNIFTEIGKRTLAIFIWHPAILTIIFSVFHAKTKAMSIWPVHYAIGSLLFACVIVLLCSSFPVVWITDQMIKLSFLKEREKEKL